jgi:hypothetical protein
MAQQLERRDRELHQLQLQLSGMSKALQQQQQRGDSQSQPPPPHTGGGSPSRIIDGPWPARWHLPLPRRRRRRRRRRRWVPAITTASLRITTG